MVESNNQTKSGYMKTHSLSIFICSISGLFFCINTFSQPFDTYYVTTNINKITIASEPDYPPYCIIDKNGKADGFSVELFLAAAKAVNIEVEIKIGIWNSIKQDLAEGNLDALPFVGRTPEREDLYDFSMPYLSLHGAIFVRKHQKKIQSLHDLKGKTILVMQGDNAEEFLRRNKISDRIILTHTFEEAFSKLASGEGDAVLTQRIMGMQLLKKMKIRSVEPLDIPVETFRQDFCFAVKKGNKELLARLNEGLSIVIASKTYDDIKLKWFGPKLKYHLDFKDKLRLILYFIIPVIFLFFLASIIILRREVKRRTLSLQNEVSEHTKTVQSLNKQQVLLHEMEKISRVGGWEYDIINNKGYWTNGVYEIYGLSKKSDANDIKDPISFFHPDDRESVKLAFFEAADIGKSYDLELRFISADGTNKWVRTAGNAEMSEGKIVRLYGNIMDITLQKQSEDELKKLKNDLEIIVTERTKELEDKVQKLNNSEKAMLYMVEDLNIMTAELKDKHNKLTEINKDLEAFSYSVSHDLRAPLRALNGFSKILLEDYSVSLDDEGKRLLQVIGSNVKKMGMLIDDLLAFSRIGRQEITFSEINMKSTAELVYQELISVQDTAGIQFLLHDIPHAFGDASMIRQVWVNLIDNALKFIRGKENRKIEIGSNIAETENIYYVKDNGAGFDMTYIHKLFGVFQRLHTEKDFEGTGVGLAIVQRIILRMGGRVWAEGEINKGATFFFSLPAKN